MDNKLNAVKSSIISFVLGDVIGLNLIFIPKKVLQESNIKNLIKNNNSNIPYGVWSDDSSMTLCTIKSIIDCNKVDLEDISKKFIAWFDDGFMTPYDKAFDIGRTTYLALSNKNGDILKGIGDIKNNGNGSLMRILPVSLYCYFNKIRDLDCFNIIKDTSSLTHAHSISILGCYIYTTIVFDILDGLDKAEIMKNLKNVYLRVPEEYRNLLKEYDFNDNNFISNGYVADSLKIAVWGFNNSNNIKDCIYKIAKLGGDKDTNCAIGSSLAGLYYGLRGENIAFDDEVIKKDMILELIDRFNNIFKVYPLV